MRRANWIVAVLISALTLAGWAWYARPVAAPDWNGVMEGIAFQPFAQSENGMYDKPNSVQVEKDVALLAHKVRNLRIYKAQGFEAVPRIAARHGLNITAGAWIDADKDTNHREVEAVIEIARSNRNVNRVLVGNEALLRGNVTVDELIQYIREVRRSVRVPVSTAEPAYIWLAHPELAKEVDFIALQLLPYWEQQALDSTLQYTLGSMDKIAAAFPEKKDKILISEIGWPSSGHMRGPAEASRTKEAVFLRRWLNFATERKLDYFVMEAFDQPWKVADEGGIGAYWGIYDANRQPKFPFTGPIEPLPNWQILAGASIFLAFPLSMVVLSLLSGLKLPGRAFIAGMIQVIAIFIVVTVHVMTDKYITVTSLMPLVVLIPSMILLFACLVTEAVELVEILWRRRFERLARPMQIPPLELASAPKVSIHVPCYNEPPEMVIETLQALSRLEYPNFEVLLLDNNTSDPALWRPVEAYCESLGPRFRFFHVERIKGFKAGALNFGLKQTAKDAEIVAVIDSDYCVDQTWLNQMVPYFADPNTAFVQAPQDYRDADDRFKTMCYWEYAGFFQLGMIQRNERNAIIQHGTMTMVRRSALEGIGGWAEWCIVEDSELGLRLFEKGLNAIYTNVSYGRGLMPDSLGAYKSQRHRWSYGAVQILKNHAHEVFAWSTTSLTWAQRYHFIAGWLPWANDAINLVIAIFAIIWTGLVVWQPRYFDYPLTILMLATLSFFVFKVTKSLWLYRVKVGASLGDTIGASIAGLGLSYTVGRAFLEGMLTSSAPFLRTPKMENKPALARALLAAREEIALLILLVGAAILIAIERGNIEPEANVWAILLLVQALPYAATLALSFINVRPKRNVIAIGQPHMAPAAE